MPLLSFIIITVIIAINLPPLECATLPRVLKSGKRQKKSWKRVVTKVRCDRRDCSLCGALEADVR